MNLFNRIRKRCNKAIGFVKLKHDKYRHDKYYQMKLIASIFAILGIIFGVGLILFGTNYGAIIPENKSFLESFNLTKQENKADQL